MTMRQRLSWGLALVLVPTLMAPMALAAPVRIDRGFGSHGIARTPLPPAHDPEPWTEVAATSDGGALTRAGYDFADSFEVAHYGPEGALLATEMPKETVLQPPEAVAADGGRVVGGGPKGELKGTVSRYRPNGSPDTSFGSGGVSESLPFHVEALAAPPSGKVLAAGSGIYFSGGAKSPPVNQVFVARLDSDGGLDPSFGEGGIVMLHSKYKVADETALHVQGWKGEGAEVVGASVVVALDASGKLDPSFGEDGQVATLGEPVSAGAAGGEGLLVAGTRRSDRTSRKKAAATEELYVARYTAAGKLDPSYAGGAGVAVLEPQGDASASSVLFEPDGSVLVGGLVAPKPVDCPRGYPCNQAPAIVRFTPDGRPDSGFGQGGLVKLEALTVRIGSGYARGVQALAARPGGGVFAAGGSARVAFVAAIGAGGSLETAFGAGGIVTKSSPHTAFAAPTGVGVDGAGKVFVVAQTNSGMRLTEGVAVLRYSPGGKLDREFGEEGEAFVPPGKQGLAVAPDGSAYVTSASESTLTKLTPAGALDPSFGAEGSVVFPFYKNHYAPEAVVRLPGGDLVVAGNLGSKHGSRPAVFRYLPDGKIDRSFGKGGVEVVKLGRGRRWWVRTMTVDRRGRILLAGSAPPRHPHGCCTHAGMLIRLDADGRLDRRFGRGGAVLAGGGAQTRVDSLALRGNRILAVATFTKFSRLADVAAGDLLFSFRPDGRLDRRFADRGVARVLLPPHRKRYDHEGEERAAVLSTSHRILVVRAGFSGPLLSFSPSGHRERNFLRRVKGLIPRRQTYAVPVSPSATLDGNSLILAWSALPAHPSGSGLRAEVNLQRLLLR
jgi:uncharacterized delta-60 repeat protein